MLALHFALHVLKHAFPPFYRYETFVASQIMSLCTFYSKYCARTGKHTVKRKVSVIIISRVYKVHLFCINPTNTPRGNEHSDSIVSVIYYTSDATNKLTESFAV